MKMTVSFNLNDLIRVGDSIADHLKMLRSAPPADEQLAQQMADASAMRLAQSLEYLISLVSQIKEFEPQQPATRPN